MHIYIQNKLSKGILELVIIYTLLIFHTFRHLCDYCQPGTNSLVCVEYHIIFSINSVLYNTIRDIDIDKHFITRKAIYV